MTLKITQNAEDKLRVYLADNPGFSPKVAVSSGGCSGFKYLIGLDKATEEDEILTLESGLEVLVPKDSLTLLDGVVLDYKETLMSSGFAFENPGAYSCGCGSSFRPKESDACESE